MPFCRAARKDRRQRAALCLVLAILRNNNEAPRWCWTTRRRRQRRRRRRFRLFRCPQARHRLKAWCLRRRLLPSAATKAHLHPWPCGDTVGSACYAGHRHGRYWKPSLSITACYIGRDGDRVPFRANSKLLLTLRSRTPSNSFIYYLPSLCSRAEPHRISCLPFSVALPARNLPVRHAYTITSRRSFPPEESETIAVLRNPRPIRR